MCGIVGIVDLKGEGRVDRGVLERMSRTLTHRGPDSSGLFVEGDVGLAMRRLSIVDLEGGDQPLYNEDRSLVMVCNGEIFHYSDLRHQLGERGHQLSTHCDVEVLLHLYEEQGVDFLAGLNGQFAFAVYDRKEHILILARDHFGINPLYYAVFDGLFLFASEIKALLEHPAVDRQVDCTGLDQIFTFPGLVSPRTMFRGISSLKSGHYIRLAGDHIEVREYWDLDYPEDGDLEERRPDEYYVDRFRELFFEAVRCRLVADVAVGFYLSGGLDSSLIATVIHALSPDSHRHSFSIDFAERSMSEAKRQEMVARHVDCIHNRVVFDMEETQRRLSDVVYHAECPLRETYNTCTMALSEAAHTRGVKVILTGEGADEIFAGYVGYRFDKYRESRKDAYDLDTIMEDEVREQIWGDKNLFYEIDHYAFNEVKTALYSSGLCAEFEAFDCLQHELVNRDRLRGRHPVHQRSYLDYRLRLADHLLGDHGDRMALANSVEGRHPFLDIDLVEFSTRIPPDLKVKDYQEKYVVREAARTLLPEEIALREKFGWYSSGSPDFLQAGVEWVQDMLSYERIKRQGFFNPDTVENLKQRYSKRGFKLNYPFENDLLIVVLTFGMLLDTFNLPDR